MAPPCYADLGKQAKDIFSKNYHIGLVKLDCKVKTDASKDLDITVGGTSATESGKVTAFMESKCNIPDYGITLKEKWHTDNVLSTEISMEDKLLKGMKIAFDSTFVPYSGKKNGMLKTAYKMENLNINTDVDLDYNGPIIHGAAVLGVKGWLAGAQASFDSAKKKLTRTNFSIGYAVNDFVLHTNVNDGQEFGGHVYQKVNENLETGIQVAWTANSNATTFGLGCVYKLDCCTSLRAKINNDSKIGLGLSHQLRKGIQLTLSAMVDGKNFSQGGHKLGVAVDLQG